ncbi:MAG TPA: FAD-dependent oxidoreductase [Roseiflexaceae bacterium]|nr:FAD-dependent oxidoreductase [Roseiflexaceae bacterium]
MYDAIVIGAGPAGLAAAAYTAQYHLKTVVIAPDLGGMARYRLQLPWMQEREVITGEDAVERLRHLLVVSPSATRYMDVVEQVFLHNQNVHVVTGEGGTFEAHSVIVASGVRPRLLGVPGEQRLLGSGVSYSATSHAPLFAGRRVVVVGHDLRALRAAIELRSIAAHVTLITADQAEPQYYGMIQRLNDDPRVTVLANHIVKEITGDTDVTGVLAIGPDEQAQLIPTEGVFIECGLQAETDFLGSLVERTPSGQIVVDDMCATSTPGIFAAGDVTSSAYAEQMLIALGEGAKAGLSACSYVLGKDLHQR